MITPILLGLAAGCGALFVVMGLWPRPVPIAEITRRLEQPHTTTTASTGGRLLDAVTGTPSQTRSADLALTGRTAADHARSRLTTAGFLAAAAAVTVIVWSVASTAPLDPVRLAVAVLVGGGVGWWLSDHQLRTDATNLRAEIRSGLVTYLHLTSTLLAGGAGMNEALALPTRLSANPAFALFADALGEAATRNVPVWAVLAEHAEAKSLAEVDELAAAVELAGTSGARTRTTLLTKADTLRRAEANRDHADAAAASESMGVPIGLMLLGFVVLVGYPAIHAVLNL